MSLRSWNRPLAALAFVLMAARAEAGLLPTVETTNANNNGTVTYTYGVVLTSGSELKTGDYFTIYDFPGMVAGSNVQPANWTLSASNTGVTPPGTVPTDSPTIPNLTWTYTGAQTLNGQLGVGNFSVISTDQPSASTTDFAALTHRQFDGQAESNITEAIVPIAGGSTPPAVPEPATLALLGIGLPLAGAFRFWRRRV